MAGKSKKYLVWGYEITAHEAAKYACVSVGAVRQMLSKLGGSMETVMRVYDERYGGVRTRLEAEKGEEAEEMAKEEILNVLFDADRAADVPVEAVAGEPEAMPTEETTEEPARTGAGWDSGEWALRKAQTPLAMEIEEVKPDREELKLLNDAIEALERLSESGWEMSLKVRRDATAMVEGWKNERLLHFKDLIDWRALEG